MLHRDLKPANILIAGDGTPMLLDFNLAAPTEIAGDRDFPGPAGEPVVHRALLGGTLPYMAPEHLDAIDPEGSTSQEAVEERSDLYALGLILFEMISGSHPFPEPPPGLTPVATIRCMIEERRPPAGSIARVPVCPEVPWSIDALVSQCIDPDPDRRYQNARDLAEDLRRFLDDLPMKHCPEPSLRERLGKWARRHPGLTGSTTIALASVVLLGLLTASIMLVYDGLIDLSARMKLQAFDRGFIDSQFLLHVAGPNDEFLKQGMQKARRSARSGRLRGRVHRRPPGPRPESARAVAVAAQARGDAAAAAADRRAADPRGSSRCADRQSCRSGERPAFRVDPRGRAWIRPSGSTPRSPRFCSRSEPPTTPRSEMSIWPPAIARVPHRSFQPRAGT